MQQIFPTSFSGAAFRVEGDILIKECRNLYESGLMQLNHSADVFRAPRVFELGNDYIAMKYLPNAVSLPVYLNECTSEEAFVVIKAIIDYIKHNDRQTTILIQPDVIVNKIKHIITRLVNYSDINLANQLADLFGVNPIEVQYGTYHGDLTFNNILVLQGRLYLIDFLPGYAPTYWLDIVKLQQECHLYWSSFFVKPALSGRYFTAIEMLRGYLGALFAQYPILRLMEALNYLRILPYANGNALIENVLRTSIKNIIDGNDSALLR